MLLAFLVLDLSCHTHHNELLPVARTIVDVIDTTTAIVIMIAEGATVITTVGAITIDDIRSKSTLYTLTRDLVLRTLGPMRWTMNHLATSHAITITTLRKYQHAVRWPVYCHIISSRGQDRRLRRSYPPCTIRRHLCPLLEDSPRKNR